MRIISFFACLLLFFGIRAQEVPVLIFLKDGKVEFVDSKKLLKIETVNKYQDENSTEKVQIQSFVLNDTVFNIPITEIDSVAFGNRKIIAMKPQVRRIDESELPFIESFNGQEIVYKSTSSPDIIPLTGSKIFHDTFCEQFPYGLCARVNSVTKKEGATIVNITELEPAEIFDEYIVSGSQSIAIPVAALSKGVVQRAASKGGFDFKLNYADSNLELNPEGYITVRFENFVGRPIKNYYHCDVYLDYEVGLKFAYHSDDNLTKSIESPEITLFKTIVAGILSPKIALCLFADLQAEAKLEYNMKRTYSTHYDWTFHNGKNKFILVNDVDEAESRKEASIEAIIDGSIHLGVESKLTMNILFDRAGVGVNAKIGPYFKGEFGFGAINDLTNNYDTELFNKASLSTSVAAKLSTYSYYYDFGANYNKIDLPFKSETQMFKRNIRLLPFFSTKCVHRNIVTNPRVPSLPETVADIATSSDTQIAKELETGYQIVDLTTMDVLAEQFDGSVYESDNQEKQIIKAQIPIDPNVSEENLKVYPVVKYGDKVIRCEPSDISNGAYLNCIYYQNAGNGYYAVAGNAVIGQVNKDETSFIIGNTLPIVKRGSEVNSHSFITVGHIGGDGKSQGKSDSIFGKWESVAEDEGISVELRQDMSCVYCGQSGVSEFNNPQSGMITLLFPNNKKVKFKVTDLSSSLMKINFPNEGKEVELFRK